MGQEKQVILCILCVLCIVHILHILMGFSPQPAWKQVLYVIPVGSTLGRLRVVPVGEKGTILLNIRIESADFLGASCDKARTVAMDDIGCRW